MESAIKRFRDEFVQHIREGGCPLGEKAYGAVNH
jgi:hypothetical protein